MNNLEKKIDALIDALGFDVEEVNHDYKEEVIAKEEFFNMCSSSPYPLKESGRKLKTIERKFERNGEVYIREPTVCGPCGCFYSVLINPIIDYKLTKKRGLAIKCTKCETHIGDGLPLDACRCNSTANLVRVRL